MAKTIRKMLMGDIWQIGEHESWFTDMAKDGWHLRKVSALSAQFQQGEPLDVRYRIDTSLNKNISPEDKEFYEQAGWTHVSKFGQFNVFSSSVQLQAPELHTDPIEQSYTLQTLDKKFRLSAILLSVLLLFSLLANAIFWFRDKTPTLALVEQNAISTYFGQLIFFYILIRATVSIRRLRKTLAEGKEIDHHAPWKRSRTMNLGILLTFIAIATISAVLPWMQIANNKTETLPQDNGNLPIVALADVEPTANFIRDEFYDENQIDWNNRYTTNSSFFAPLQYESNETGIVSGNQWADRSGAYSPNIHTQVYKVRFSFLAKNLAADLLTRSNRRDYREEDFIKLDHKGFDSLAIREIHEVKEVFAAKGKGVSYTLYIGNADMEVILKNVEEKLTLIEK